MKAPASVSSKPFLLAVKSVIFDDQQRCLLLRRSAINRHFVGCWEWPGGKIDPGEDFVTALHREVLEETSLIVQITGLAGAVTYEMTDAHIVLLCLETRCVSGEVRLSTEHDDFAWVPLSELSRRLLPNQVRDFMLEYTKKAKNN